jgi:hypothetical protein
LVFVGVICTSEKAGLLSNPAINLKPIYKDLLKAYLNELPRRKQRNNRAASVHSFVTLQAAGNYPYFTILLYRAIGSAPVL